MRHSANLILRLSFNEDSWIATPASRQARNDKFGVIASVTKQSKTPGYRVYFWFVILSLAFIQTAGAESQPLPRFVGLRSKAVNTHVGPGGQYPIEWRYGRQNLPVEIIAEFDTWRQIRDSEGAIGWVHKSLLSGKRHVMVLQKNRKLFHKPDIKASVVAIAEPGVLGRLLECHQEWCRVDTQGHKGWIKRRFLWGIYPHEEKIR
jgi:SH3-like domain-containing protein